MTTTKLFVRSIAAMGVLLAVSAPALAGKAGEFTVGANAEYFWPDRVDMLLEKGAGYRLHGGYRFTDALGVSASYSEVSGEVDGKVPVIGGLDAELKSWRVEGQYFMNTSGATQPYVSLGIQNHDKVDIEGNFDQDLDMDKQLTIGAGVRHYFNPHFSLNAGLNASHDFGDVTDFGAGVGVAFHFGGSEDAAPASEPAPVAPAACADSDADGVCDNVDQCPGTPPGVQVDATGCPPTMKEQVSIELKVQFDFDKSLVKPEYMGEIEKAASFLKEHPETVATLEGHTCDIGTDEYNQKLSERRANAVRDILVKQFGVDGSRLKAEGFGEVRPLNSNADETERSLNRRTISTIQVKAAQ
ncbi:MAG: OmpA family protein [Gammaproteobacteria bacterium]|nr:OmpA family protein [Gammaproteobacteria bacterium]